MELLLAASDVDIAVQDGEYFSSKQAIITFIKECGSFVAQSFLSADIVQRDFIVAQVGKLVLGLFMGVSRLCAIRDSRNAPADFVAPPVLPAQLCRLSPSWFF